MTVQANCPDFSSEVLEALQVECSSCHGQVVSEGGYRLDSYAAAFEPDSNGARRIIPGSSGSLILTRASDENDYHTPKSEVTVPLLTRWVVECRANYLPNDLVHPLGWVTPGSEESHAVFLRASGWPLEDCEECHGAGTDPAGGIVERSCTACHADGPTACDTCHGTTKSAAPPPSAHGSYSASDAGVGAHAAHVFGGAVLSRSVSCDECHIVPTDWRDPGHIFDENGKADKDGRAEVVFGATASITVPGHDEWRSGTPTYDPATGTCSEVYCHGGVLPEDRKPIWTAERGVACTDDSTCEGGYACFADVCTPTCTFCHDLPPGGDTHAADLTAADCTTCHSSVIDENLTFVDASQHLDGTVEIGDGGASCTGCHGSAANGNAAPPVGLGGETSTDDPKVGAHQAHLGTLTFSSPLSCDACHIEPEGDTFLEAVVAEGHMDSSLPAEVFPGGSAFPGLGGRRGATPVYDGSAATCSGVYCHGGGTNLSDDTTATIVRTPSWTDVGNGTIVCGSCHGVPPVGHFPDYALKDCTLCHSQTVDDQGDIIFDENGNTLHINGNVEGNQ